MCDLNQEPKEMPFNNQEDDSIDLSLLHLNSLNYHNHPPPPCTTCGCTTAGSMKRPSPENPTKNSSAKHKKLFHEQQQETVSNSNNLGGFTKVTLPVLTTTGPSSSGLRRCISEPMDSMNLSVPQSPPENAKIIAPSSSSAVKGSCSSALPPLPPPLRRSISDPITSSPAKSFSRSSCSNDVEESPSYKKLKLMKDRMRELSQQWDEILPDEEDVGTEDTNNNATEDDNGTEFEEAVTVERAGEGLIVHFKCPCGKGYHILLSGRSCYYKLM